jgi:isoleucyl-tRNA synthetase
VTAAFESYQFFSFFQTVQNFCVVDLSNFYLDIAKDRLYISATDAFRRRSCQTVLAKIVENLARAIAPVLCHMAEDIWQNLPYQTPQQSVFEAGWVKLEDRWRNPELAKRWQTLRFYRTEANKVLENARKDKKIGSSLEAKVKLYVADEAQREELSAMNPALAVAPTTASEATPEAPEPTSDVVTEPPAEMAEASKSSSQLAIPDWENLEVRDVLEFVSEVPRYAADFWRTYNKAFINLGLLGGIVFSLYVSSSLLAAVNRLVLLPDLFTLLGFGVSLRFGYRNVLYASDRQKLLGRIDDVKTKVLGSNVELPPEAIQQVEDKPVLPPEEASHPIPEGSAGNGVDELRYLFICSQVELVDSPQALDGLEYVTQDDGLGIGVVTAEGEKCERCWNYSTHVGESAEHPTICERCVEALDGKF